PWRQGRAFPGSAESWHSLPNRESGGAEGFRQMPAAHGRISAGRGLDGVLLGLDDHPALITRLGQEPGEGVVVDHAVAGEGEDAFQYGCEERLVALAGAAQHVGPDILAMDVIDALTMAPRRL